MHSKNGEELLVKVVLATILGAMMTVAVNAILGEMINVIVSMAMSALMVVLIDWSWDDGEF